MTNSDISINNKGKIIIPFDTICIACKQKLKVTLEVDADQLLEVLMVHGYISKVK